MISLVEVLAIHDRIVSKTGGALGVRDEAGLLSALGRPFQTFDGCDLYPSLFDKAGALLESLCNNHPFVDGNKRTALVAAAFLLHKNGIDIEIPTDAGETFMLEVAQGKSDASTIAAQLEMWRSTR